MSFVAQAWIQLPARIFEPSSDSLVDARLLRQNDGSCSDAAIVVSQSRVVQWSAWTAWMAMSDRATLLIHARHRPGMLL